ncbi:MAG: flagellar export chaperone FliS [Fibrobacterota bacterium]
MNPNTAYTSYKTANVNTTDQGRLIIICYDVAIKSCVQAKELMEQKKPVEKAKKLYKAQDAITELMIALNMEKGGAFAKRLFSLYDYFNWRLSEANVKQSTAMIDEVLRHLKSLREAWLVAIEKVRKEKAPSLAVAEGTLQPALRLVG